MGIGAATMEANATMRSIVRRDPGIGRSPRGLVARAPGFSPGPDPSSSVSLGSAVGILRGELEIQSSMRVDLDLSPPNRVASSIHPIPRVDLVVPAGTPESG